MVETLVVKLSRQELYNKIWEILVDGIAKEFNILYAQLMKQVKAANIPIPPSGYWTKLSLGKPVEKTLLNNPKDSIVSLYKTVETIIPREVISAPAIPKTNKATQHIIAEKPVTPLLEDDKTKIPLCQKNMSLPKHTNNMDKPIFITEKEHNFIFYIYKKLLSVCSMYLFRTQIIIC